MGELRVEATGGTCGARAWGVDLTEPLDADILEAIRAAWLEHLVLVFPDQDLDDRALETVTNSLGGNHPQAYIRPEPGTEHVRSIRRKATGDSWIFAHSWHSDYSFLPVPPAGACLYAVTIPPEGGDTLFANQHQAWETLSDDRKDRLRDLVAVHSAVGPFSPQGNYGIGYTGSMRIVTSETALEESRHPLVLTHAETGRKALYSTRGYIRRVEGMPPEESADLLEELHAWQTDERFVHRHRWEEGMLVILDNRALLHRATGGYDGHARELRRTLISPPA